MTGDNPKKTQSAGGAGHLVPINSSLKVGPRPHTLPLQKQQQWRKQKISRFNLRFPSCVSCCLEQQRPSNCCFWRSPYCLPIIHSLDTVKPSHAVRWNIIHFFPSYTFAGITLQYIKNSFFSYTYCSASSNQKFLRKSFWKKKKVCKYFFYFNNSTT